MVKSTKENTMVLKPVFRFWGYSRLLHHEMVGSGCVINGENLPTSIPHFGNLHFTQDLTELIGHDMPGPYQDQPSWLLYDPTIKPEGKPLAWITTDNSDPYPLITRTSHNDFHFWFDVDRTIRFIQNEEHLKHEAPLYVRLGINPHKLPRYIRDAAFHGMHKLRRICSAEKAMSKGLAAVDLWRGLIRQIIETHSNESPTPFWPDGKKYACAASHDLDTVECFHTPKLIDQFRCIDDDSGLRTAWMVVEGNLSAGRSALNELHEYGHEIGFHGTTHDHKLAFASPAEMARRIAKVKALITSYGTTGFRSPAYLRSPRLYRALDGILTYDMSMHDTIEGVCRPSPANEGCGTCHPFIIRGTDVLEIPTTITEDWQFDLMGIHNCDTILSVQIENLTRIKKRGGIANVLTHTEPEPTTKPFMIEAYHRLMTYMSEDSQAWLASPGEINLWWRARMKSIDRHWAQDIAYPPMSTSIHDILPTHTPRQVAIR